MQLEINKRSGEKLPFHEFQFLQVIFIIVLSNMHVLYEMTRKLKGKAHEILKFRKEER